MQEYDNDISFLRSDVTPSGSKPMELIKSRGADFANAWVKMYAKEMAEKIIARAREKKLDIGNVKAVFVEELRSWEKRKDTKLPYYRKKTLIDAVMAELNKESTVSGLAEAIAPEGKPSATGDERFSSSGGVIVKDIAAALGRAMEIMRPVSSKHAIYGNSGSLTYSEYTTAYDMILDLVEFVKPASAPRSAREVINAINEAKKDHGRVTDKIYSYEKNEDRAAADYVCRILQAAKIDVLEIGEAGEIMGIAPKEAADLLTSGDSPKYILFAAENKTYCIAKESEAGKALSLAKNTAPEILPAACRLLARKDARDVIREVAAGKDGASVTTFFANDSIAEDELTIELGRRVGGKKTAYFVSYDINGEKGAVSGAARPIRDHERLMHFAEKTFAYLRASREWEIITEEDAIQAPDLMSRYKADESLYHALKRAIRRLPRKKYTPNEIISLLNNPMAGGFKYKITGRERWGPEEMTRRTAAEPLDTTKMRGLIMEILAELGSLWGESAKPALNRSRLSASGELALNQDITISKIDAMIKKLEDKKFKIYAVEREDDVRKSLTDTLKKVREVVARNPDLLLKPLSAGAHPETKSGEGRGVYVPDIVPVLRSLDIDAIIGKGAGGAGFEDADYMFAGAEIVDTAKEVFAQVDIDVHVKEMQDAERGFIRPGNNIYNFGHYAGDMKRTAKDAGTGATFITFENIIDLLTGRKPILEGPSEKAAVVAAYNMAVGIMNFGDWEKAARSKEAKAAEKAIKEYDRTNIAPAPEGIDLSGKRVVIFGGGVVGYTQANMLARMNAKVTIVEKRSDRRTWLRKRFAEDGLRNSVDILSVDDKSQIDADLKWTDGVSTTAYDRGIAAQTLVDKATQDMLSEKGGVFFTIVDIDQGGGVEGVHSTTHDDPVYKPENSNNMIYAVPNIPAKVPRQTSIDISLAAAEDLIIICLYGLEKALEIRPHLAYAVELAGGRITSPTLMEEFNKRGIEVPEEIRMETDWNKMTPLEKALDKARKAADAIREERVSSPETKAPALSILNKLNDFLYDIQDDAGASDVVAISEIFFRAYAAELTGEMSAKKLSEFEKNMKSVLSITAPGHINAAIDLLRKSTLHHDTDERSVVNGLYKMVIRASKRQDFDGVKLTTTEPSVSSLLSRYGYLVESVFEVKKPKSGQAVGLAKPIFDAYCEAINNPDITQERAEELGGSLAAAIEGIEREKRSEVIKDALSIVESVHLDNSYADSAADKVVKYLVLTLQGEAAQSDAGGRLSSSGDSLVLPGDAAMEILKTMQSIITGNTLRQYGSKMLKNEVDSITLDDEQYILGSNVNYHLNGPILNLNLPRELVDLLKRPENKFQVSFRAESLRKTSAAMDVLSFIRSIPAVAGLFLQGVISNAKENGPVTVKIGSLIAKINANFNGENKRIRNIDVDYNKYGKECQYELVLTQSGVPELKGPPERLSASGEAASPEDFTDYLNGMMTNIRTHLNMREAPIAFNNVAIVMKKDLAMSITGEKGSLGVELSQKYQTMKQHLRSVFGGDEGIIEVTSTEELITEVNRLRSDGMKVVVLDDGSLIKKDDNIKLNGKSGEDYCVISTESIKPTDDLTIPFINLNAMALMGVGVLDKNDTLFKFAYQAFTGNEPEEGLLTKIRDGAVWIIKALPKLIRFDASERPRDESIRKLFAAAA